MWYNLYFHFTKHKMMFLYGVIIIVILNVQIIDGVKDGRAEISGKQNILLHHAVRTLLGFNNSPTFRSRLLPNPDKLSEEAPKYMMDLYERFKNTRISKGHLFGNTVRSIQAEIAEVNGEAMFVFNLTSVKPNERLLSAEIHLYKKKAKKPWHRKRDVEMELYEIAPHYMTQNGKITMRAESFGWQWYDVTNAVDSCLAARRAIPHIFALNFKFEKPNGKLRRLALQKFIRHHSKPFLIVYSNDTQNINFSEFDQLSGADIAESFLPKNLDNPNIEIDQKRTLSDTKSEDSPSTNNKSKKSKLKIRGKRSIFNNEIPEDPADYHKFKRRFNLPPTHPGILQTRRESRHKLSDPQLIPYPDKKNRRRNRRKNRKGRKYRRKHGKRRRKNQNIFPKEWDSYDTGNRATKENSNGGVCSRRKLIVDFADISWGEWIISPKSFEAHYCAGSCPFPLTKRLRPSNHATIQSMVHAIGIYSDVPAPCCVPDSMSSVTLLYFDENRNVVLKNYPSMTVNSCACR